MKKQKLKQGIVKAFQFILNPRLIFCFGIAWMITNGWSYLMLGLGTYLEIGWMIAVAGAYLTFLWLPISPEKLVTVAIAIFLLRKLFPKDKKTLAVLRNLHQSLVSRLNNRGKKRARNKQDENSYRENQ